MLPHRILYAVLALLAFAIAPRAQQRAAAESGITGQVLAPDGSPVTQGNVMLMTSPTARVNAAIDRAGHFRIVPETVGWQRLLISVPGFAPHRVNVTVPSSRRMLLPEITLIEATYFRARFVTTEGEPLAAAGLRRRSIDSDGVTIADPLDHVREQIEADGSITVGPLPPGRTMLAFDRPALAQTRLRDVDVAAGKRVIESGTITIEPGARLLVDILDGDGKPVPRHDVSIEDAVRPSPLSFPATKTDGDGRAVFTRLASGRYRVWTKTVDRCSNQEITTSRLVSTSGSGEVRLRLVIGGRAAFRITSPLGPVSGRSVFVSPDSPPETPWQARLMEFLPRRRLEIAPASQSSCAGVTDQDGRVAMAPFPPGPSQLRLHLFTSTYIARVPVPEGGRELVLAVPDGLLSVRVTDRITNQPVQGAKLIWVGGGGRVEALATANGDALLESVGRTGGTLTISARDYQTLEGRFDETPETLQEVALAPSPGARLAIRVVSSEGKELAGSLVELLARGPADVAEFVTADTKGVAAFVDVPAGDLQFTARAEGFAPKTVRIAEDRRVSVVITLERAQGDDQRVVAGAWTLPGAVRP